MRKGYQNDAQMDAKIHEISHFFGKGENARNYLFYNRKRGSEHLKIKKKSIQNRWKIKARTNDAERSKNTPKGRQNGYRNQSKWPKGANGEPKGVQKGEKGWKKNMPKTKPKKGRKMDAKRFGPAECAWPPQSAIMALPGLTRPILTESNTAVAPRRGAPY